MTKNEDSGSNGAVWVPEKDRSWEECNGVYLERMRRRAASVSMLG